MTAGRTFDLGISGLEPGTRIGEGGNAVVYRARQPELDRDIAVKILKEADPDTRRRFDRERRAMGRLSQHDGIVTVYDSGYTAHEEPYLIMPLLEGSLEDELRAGGPMPWREAVALMAEVCETVAYAHEQGVVHRDLKPANLMRTRSGRPLVADFGISRITDASASLKSTAITLTPAFSPPEALEAAPAAPSADVYSLGATLYALLAGHPPFMDDPDVSLLVLMRKIIEAPLPSLPASVPEDVRQIVESAMAKNPASRYTDAGHMAAWLRHALGTAATAEPASSEVAPSATRTVEASASFAVAPDPPSTEDPAAAVSAPTQPVPDLDAGEAARGPGRSRLWALAPVVVLAGALAFAGWLVTRSDSGGEVADAPTDAVAAVDDAAAEVEDAAADVEDAAADVEQAAEEVEEALADTFAATPEPEEESADDGGDGEGGDGDEVEAPLPVDLAGTTVRILGPETSADETGAIQDALDEFASANEMTIVYEPERLVADRLMDEVASGAPPDIAVSSQPSQLRELARDGDMFPLRPRLIDAFEKDWHPTALDPGIVDGVPYSVPTTSDVKSLIWYQPDRFARLGYDVPGSFTELLELTDRMIADGNTPFCVGIESGAATGWVYTDWVEDVMLRLHPPVVYDAWVNNELAFASPEVSTAMQTVVDLWTTPGFVHASTGSLVTTSFSDNTEPLVAGDCLMHRQASFYVSFFADDVAFADGRPGSVDVFYLPAGPAGGHPVLTTGTLAGVFADRPEVWAVMEYLVSADYANARQRSHAARLGGPGTPTGFTTANQNVDRTLWAPLERNMLDVLANADVIRWDASDVMPGEVGAGTFWSEGTALFAEDRKVLEAAEIIDRSWPE